MSKLSTGLETIDYDQPGWNFIFDKDFELLADKYLKLSALLDTLFVNLQDHQVPIWDSVAGKFKNRSF